MWKKLFVALVIPLLFGQLHATGQSLTGPVTEQYGVADDGTPLTWMVFPAKGSGKHPNVLVIHGGGFSTDPADPMLLNCAKDLSAAGMNAFVIQYRLAPPGMIPGQVSDGRYPDQSNDVSIAVRAARADSRGNGKVGAVGGSAGGSHTIYNAATGTPGDNRIDAGVSLSGAYDYADKASWKWQGGAFYGWVTNYVGSTDATLLDSASPVSFIRGPLPPLELYASSVEPMPPQQLTNLVAQLNVAKIRNYEQTVIPGRQHAFAYWDMISSDVITFLLPLLQ